MIHLVETIDRTNYERFFFTREPYLLISIRRPGSHHVRIACKQWCMNICQLMLHESPRGQRTTKGAWVELSVPRAVKLTEFVNQNRSRARQLVIQSEEASCQVSAIAECICRWLEVPIYYGGRFCAPDRNAAITLQMAIDAHELERCNLNDELRNPPKENRPHG